MVANGMASPDCRYFFGGFQMGRLLREMRPGLVQALDDLHAGDKNL
jgi:hypothetical protein